MSYFASTSSTLTFHQCTVNNIGGNQYNIINPAIQLLPIGRSVVLERLLEEGDKFRLYAAKDNGKVVIIKQYKNVHKEKFLQSAQSHHTLWHINVAQLFRLEENDRSLYFHGYEKFYPAMSTLDAITSLDVKPFFARWRNTTQSIDNVAREQNITIAWEACKPDWFWHNGLDWVLIHWEEGDSLDVRDPAC
jgi:hypothetical protein